MNSRCYVIAEAGLNHNGDLEIAKRLIAVASEAGADCVKFQKRHVATLAVSEILDAKDDRFPALGTTYRELRERHEFSLGQFQELKAAAEAAEMDFLCTPFDRESVDFLEELSVGAYKVASHSNTNLPLLRHIASLGKPTFMSAGACTLEELDDAVDVFKSAGTHLTVLHCVSSYPTPAEEENLSSIGMLRERYEVPVGYSGHEIGYVPTLAAVALGAVAVERHFTLDKTTVGFDHRISLEPEELGAMVRDIRTVEASLGSPRKEVSERELITRNKYKVSMVTSRPIPEGTVITEEMVTYRNPGTGIHPRDAASVLGKRAAVDIAEDTLIETRMVRG